MSNKETKEQPSFKSIVITDSLETNGEYDVDDEPLVESEEKKKDIYQPTKVAFVIGSFFFLLYMIGTKGFIAIVITAQYGETASWVPVLTVLFIILEIFGFLALVIIHIIMVKGLGKSFMKNKLVDAFVHILKKFKL